MRQFIVGISLLGFCFAATGCKPSVNEQRAQARSEWKQQMSTPVDSGGVVAATNK